MPESPVIDSRLVLGPDDAGRSLTREEYAAADRAAPFQYERVRGRLVVMSPAGPEHRGVSRPFRRILGHYWGEHPDFVDDVDVEGWLATSEDDDRHPDICIYLAGPDSDQVVPDRVPALVFEFVSGSRADQERDYVFKREEYHRAGVKEYVIVDRFKRSVLVLEWEAGDWRERTLGPTETYATPLLPGLAVPLEEAFAHSVG